jgi:hypothetical protein
MAGIILPSTNVAHIQCQALRLASDEKILGAYTNRGAVCYGSDNEPRDPRRGGA